VISVFNRHLLEGPQWVAGPSVDIVGRQWLLSPRAFKESLEKSFADLSQRCSLTRTICA
jgi:hypothetical protein